MAQTPTRIYPTPTGAPIPTAPNPSVPRAPTSPGSYKGVVINPGSDAMIAAQIATINGTPPVPIPQTDPVITAGTIMGTTPVTIPPITPTVPMTPTVPAPTGTTTDPNGNAVITPPTTETKPEKSTYDSIRERLGILGDTLSTKAEETRKLEEETQLTKKTEQAAIAYNTYIQKKLEFDQKLVEMKTAEANTQGAYGGGYSASIRDFEMKSNANLANLAIQAQVAQGLEDAARQTIKDKLDMQFQPVQDEIDFLVKFAALNENDLTEKEKIQLQTMSDEKKAEKSSVQKAAETIHEALLKNGAPTSVYSDVDKVVSDYAAGKISASEAQSQMFAAAGSYGMTRTAGEGGALSILDIARYQELYPDAGVVAGDSEATANQKVTASNSPEAKTRNLITSAKENGNDYKTVINEINSDDSITDKATAIKIANEVFGIESTAASKIETEISQMKKSGKLTTGDIRASLKNRYSQAEINGSSVGNVVEQISTFLFGK